MNKIRNYLNWIAVIFAFGFIIGLILKINNLYLISILIVLTIWGLEILQFLREQKEIKINNIQIFQEKYNSSSFLSYAAILFALGVPVIDLINNEISIRSIFVSIVFLMIGFRSFFFPYQSGRVIIVSDNGLTFGFMNRFIEWSNISSFQYESNNIKLNLKFGLCKKIVLDLGLHENKEMIVRLIESKIKINVA
jgi:hypothetical protein